MLGIPLVPEQVIDSLEALGCAVQHQEKVYTVTVPSWRATDLHLPEDIAEEVGRLIGYQAMPADELPPRPSRPLKIGPVLALRELKKLLAYGFNVQEIYSYPFFDEEFLRQLKLEISDSITIKNPVSRQWSRLVTSLVPNLLRAVHTNIPDVRTMRFFEVANVWRTVEAAGLQETRTLALLWYDFHQPIDFYEAQKVVYALLRLFGLEVEWKHLVSSDAAGSGVGDTGWWDASRTAALYHNSVCIGHVGLLNKAMQDACEGHLWAAELNIGYLLAYAPEEHVYRAPSKYQRVFHDVSMLVSYSVSVASLTARVAAVDSRIIEVVLIDMFEKKEWNGRRSLTIRVTYVSETETLTRAEIDEIREKVQELLVRECGAEIR